MNLIAVGLAAIGVVFWIAGLRTIFAGKRMYAELRDAGALSSKRQDTRGWQQMLLGRKSANLPREYNSLAMKALVLITSSVGCVVLAWSLSDL